MPGHRKLAGGEEITGGHLGVRCIGVTPHYVVVSVLPAGGSWVVGSVGVGLAVGWRWHSHRVPGAAHWVSGVPGRWCRYGSTGSSGT